MHKNQCRVCGKPTIVMCYRGTGVCSDLCRRVDLGEITKEEAATEIRVTESNSEHLLADLTAGAAAGA